MHFYRLTRAPPRSAAPRTPASSAALRLCSSPCGPFVPEYAEHRRTAAGHQGGDSAMLPQQGLDGPGILCSAALFQRIAGGGTKGIQISGTDSGFLRSAVRVDAAAHRS